MNKPMLYDTTLAAIVRDEEDNSAHGVRLWLESTLPYVEAAVVVDTGSVDNTRLILAELEGEYPNLHVYDRPFDDFASSRNYSLEMAKEHTKNRMILVLDADELLLPEEYGRLNNFVRQNPATSYDFDFMKIYPDGTLMRTMTGVQTRRLFYHEYMIFLNERSNGIYECAKYRDFCKSDRKDIGIPKRVAIIKHFLPDEEAKERKRNLWYDRDEIHQYTPYDHAINNGWKQRNPARDLFNAPESEIKKTNPDLVCI